MLIDKGHSRLALIPTTHNYAGFPDGIAGQALLARLGEQLSRYDGRIVRGA